MLSPGYGRFNHKLLFGLWLAVSSHNVVATETAYSLPAAECDLQLTAIKKGEINAALYIGMEWIWVILLSTQ